jgi:nitrite reductase/ring-hydroxylating ferredoxin subunit
MRRQCDRPPAADSATSGYVDVGLRVHRLKYGRWKVRIGGWDILVTASPFRVRAFEDRCPHQGLSLECGAISGGRITCPHHGRHFDLRDGRPLPSRGDPLAVGHPLRVFSVIRKGARLLVRLPQP